MKNSKYLILFLAFFSACVDKKNKDVFLQSSEVDYKMVTYESKAWVDSINFPTIKIFGENFYQVYKKNKIIDEGEIIKNTDTFSFKINNTGCITNMKGYFLDKSKNILRIYNLVGIGVEAKHGDFERIN
jgi:hypothetical protein